VGFVEHAALRQGLSQYGNQLCGIFRHALYQRLVAVERRGRCPLAVHRQFLQQIADHAAGIAQRSGNRNRLSFGGGFATIGDEGESQLAVGFGDFEFQAVAGFGRKRQGKGDFPLADHRPVGAVGLHALDFGHDPLSWHEVAENVGNALDRRDRLGLLGLLDRVLRLGQYRA
jgi:hypothetical protein